MSISPKNMKIENARYELDGLPGYYALRFDVGGRTYSISSEIKAGVLAQGKVYFDGGLVENADLLRLSTAFMLEGYYGRTKEGPAVLVPDLDELRELGDRLAKYAPEGWSIEGWLGLFNVNTPNNESSE